jgi:DNA-binding XRE family transcriptional regulator
METITLKDELRARRELPGPDRRRELRKAAGVTLDALAREVGVTRQCIGHWEAGRRYPRSPGLQRYVAALRLLQEEARAA